MSALALVISKNESVFLDILADSIENMAPIMDWFKDLNFDDPDLTDARLLQYRDINLAVNAVVNCGIKEMPDPASLVSASDPVMRALILMLFEQTFLTSADFNAVENAVKQLCINSNKSLGEMFSIQLCHVHVQKHTDQSDGFGTLPTMTTIYDESKVNDVYKASDLVQALAGLDAMFPNTETPAKEGNLL